MKKIIPCKCGNLRPEDKLANIQDEYYNEEFEEVQNETREKKIAKYEAMIDAIKHGEIL